MLSTTQPAAFSGSEQPAPASPAADLGLWLSSVNVSELTGNNDRLWNPGETLSVIPTLVNSTDQTYTGVHLSLEVNHAGVDLIDGAARTIGDLASGAATVVNNAYEVELGASLGDLETVDLQFRVQSDQDPIGTTIPYELRVVSPGPLVEVPVDFAPGPMIADPRRNLVYLVDNSDLRVLAIDTDSGRLVDHAPLGVGTVPVSLAISREGDRLFVGYADPHKIEVFSLPNLEPLSTLDVAITPASLVYGAGDRLYASSGGQIYQLDARTGELLRQVRATGDSVTMRVDEAGDRLFAFQRGDHRIVEYDLAGGTELVYGKELSPLRDVSGVEIDNQHNRLYVAHSNALSYIDLADEYMRVVAYLPSVGLAVNPQTSELYVSSGAIDQSALFRYDTADTASLGHQYLGDIDRLDFAVTPNGRQLLALVSGTGASAVPSIGLIGGSDLTVTRMPAARFSVTSDPETPRTFRFDTQDSATLFGGGLLVNYAWDFGDGTQGDGVQTVHTFPDDRPYPVRLRVTTNQDRSDELEKWTTVVSPRVEPLLLTTQEDAAVEGDLAAVGSGMGPLSFALIQSPRHGTATLDGTHVRYVPNKDFHGEDQIVLWATDPTGGTAPAPVGVTVAAVNDAPQAHDDRISTLPGRLSAPVDVLKNDFDPEGDPLTATILAPPQHGSVIEDSPGVFRYQPEEGFLGVDSFTYSLTDPSGAIVQGRVTAAVEPIAVAGDWPSRGNGPANSGYYSGTTGGQVPAPAWTFADDLVASKSIAVGDGRIYLVAQEKQTPWDQYLLALDPDSGVILWRYRCEKNETLGPPAFDNGVVYLVRANGGNSHLVALNASTGEEIWKTLYAGPQYVYFPPTVASGKVWVDGGSSKAMAIFDAANGQLLSEIPFTDVDGWAPKAAGDKVVAVVADRMYVFDQRSGQPLQTSIQLETDRDPNSWTTSWETSLDDHRAYVATRTNLVAYDLDTHQVRWRKSGQYSGTAVAQGLVYGVMNNRVDVFKAETGEQVATYQAATPYRDTTDDPISLYSTPIVTDDSLVVSSARDTFVFALGDPDPRYVLPYGGPVAVADGAIYLTGSVPSWGKTWPTNQLRKYAFRDNQSPVLTPAPGVAVTTDEDTPTQEILVRDLLGQLGADAITDADDTWRGIAVFAAKAPPGGGGWQYSTDGQNWTGLAVTPTTAMLLAADDATRIRYSPPANYHGTIADALQFYAWDGTVGENGLPADVSKTGGNTAFSAQEAVIPLVINSVNDPPIAIDLDGNTVRDQSPLGTVVGLFSTQDADYDDTFTYAVTSQDDALTVVGNELRTAKVLDAERTPTLAVSVQVTDQGGVTIERQFTIRVEASGRWPVAMPGVYDPGTSRFFLKDRQESGDADRLFSYGVAGLGWIPLTGDWDGDGIESQGLYDPQTGTFFLKNQQTAGDADYQFTYGLGGQGWVPLVGDWNADGIDTVGVYVPDTSTFFLRNENSSGNADTFFSFGVGGLGWQPIAGDWLGQGRDTVGLYAPDTSLFFLRDIHSAGAADHTFQFGIGGLGWRPLAGNWDASRGDGVGLYAPDTGQFFLLNRFRNGAADLSFSYGIGGQGWMPLVGDWDGPWYQAGILPPGVSAAPNPIVAVTPPVVAGSATTVPPGGSTGAPSIDPEVHAQALAEWGTSTAEPPGANMFLDDDLVRRIRNQIQQHPSPLDDLNLDLPQIGSRG